MKKIPDKSKRPIKPGSTEFSFIEALRQRTIGQIGQPSLIHGIGDDAAIIQKDAKTDLVVTTDLLVEEIDFRRDWAIPELLGHKALAVSLSDVAAMGAVPRWAMVSIGLPAARWRAGFLKKFYDGWFALAEQVGVQLIGGDTSSTPDHIVIDSMVLGEVRRGRAVMRSGARPGDQIYVTGQLGGAAGGLGSLQAGSRLHISARHRKKVSATEALLLRQLRPSARTAWGKLLGDKRLATAMIDISDGLSSDLAHICRASGAGALVEAEAIPVDQHLRSIEMNSSKTLGLALNGGEDFELLFTVSADKAKKLTTEVEGVPVARIGEITDRSGQILINENGRWTALEAAGFDHFSNG
ncbi:MAG: thiamine-phosphate kinase [Pyrinomonadaceae bacterium]